MIADLLLTNGQIYTLDPQQPRASAVALRGDEIVAVGDENTLRNLLAPGGEQVDLGGRCVTPGLVDAHVHFEGFAIYRRRVNLDGATSLAEALSRVAAYAGEQRIKGDRHWLQGRGWSQDAWTDTRFPTAAHLDHVVAERPVCLRHKSGHAAWVNTRALQLANITAQTPDPPGGQIGRDSAGQPNGILYEDAMELVTKQIPAPTHDEIVAAMRDAQRYCWQVGLTGLHDFDGRSCFAALQELHQEGELGLRVVKNIPVKLLDHAVGVGLRSGFGDRWLRIGGIKIFADGALGPHTAAMVAPYEDEPENYGIVVTDKETMFAAVSEASAHGLSATIHAIGDRANHDVLDVYEAVRGEERQRLHAQGRHAPSGARPYTGPGFPRHRIEHVQILHPEDLGRLARLNIVASMQPIHATSDMDMADRFWGDRARYSYAWRTMLESGATLAFGSDAPVEPIDPIPGLHAAVTRRRADGAPGPDGWYPEQRLTITEAVTAFTAGPAATVGRAHRQGTLSPGKLADLTIYERDIFAIPPDELLEVQIAGTITGGRFRYRSW